MLRFAPSPTGDMHIGNLRVALFNYILSKQLNEALTIRIEDTDKERNIDGKDKEILDILNLFGIEYSNVLYQSNNLKYHRQLAMSLLQNRKAFNCFCTPELLDKKREEAKANKIAYRYDGHCLNIPAMEVLDREDPFVVRLQKPANTVVFVDKVKGKASFAPDDIDAFIVMRKDKNPTYNFACAVDDMLSDISLVIRGEDHFTNTSKQIAVRDALGYDKKIEYAHLPIILNDEGKKMSKRDDASSVKWLLSEGFLPEAIANYLILLGNKPPKEIFTLKEALEWFDITDISKAPARFDLQKLRFINREHLKMMDEKELSRYVGFADAEVGALAKLYLEEASTTVELRSKIGPIFEPKVSTEYQEGLDTLKKAVQNLPRFEEFNDFKKALMDESGLKGKNFFKPLRILLTGAENGPEVSKLYPLLKNYLMEIVK